MQFSPRQVGFAKDGPLAGSEWGGVLGAQFQVSEGREQPIPKPHQKFPYIDRHAVRSNGRCRCSLLPPRLSSNPISRTDSTELPSTTVCLWLAIPDSNTDYPRPCLNQASLSQYPSLPHRTDLEPTAAKDETTRHCKVWPLVTPQRPSSSSCWTCRGRHLFASARSAGSTTPPCPTRSQPGTADPARHRPAFHISRYRSSDGG